MRLQLAFAVLVSTSLTPAFAAEFHAVSRVDAVTVFPSGAEVTRTASQEVAAGDHTLVFDNLPGDLQAETIRVEGTSDGGIEIGSVDSKVVPVPSAETDARRRKIDADIEALSDERASLDQAISDAEYQKSLMQQLASGAFTQPAKDGETKVFGAPELGSLLDLVGGKLQALSKTVMEARLRQRAIDRSIGELQAELAGLSPQTAMRTVVTVHLAAPAAASGTFRLKYRIAEAGWHPIYDARLASPDKAAAAKIEIVRRAEVAQATTEDWSDVALTLSTARPVGATSAPDLAPDQLVFAEPRAEADALAVGGALQRMDAPAPATEMLDENGIALRAKKSEDKMAQMQAEVVVAGFQALYAIPGRVSVDNTGTAKKVRIGTDGFDARLKAETVPKLDPNAYLTAAFTLAGPTPLLPGPVMLYRDGVFVGQGALPLLSPGEEAKLGFGADDLVKVTRAEVKRLSGEEGLLTTSKVDTRAYDITIRNLHDFTLPVTVIDQLPVSEIEDVVVETLAGMTAPTERDYRKKPGVLAWSFDLEAKAEKLVRHGYTVTSPKDMKVGMNIN